MSTSVLFWGVALALTAVALAFLLPGLLRHRRLPATRMAGLVLVLVLPPLAVVLYFHFGAPKAVSESSELAPDLAPTTAADYVTRLESHLKRQPRDARGWVLLGRAHAQADRFDAAAQAFGQAIEVSPGKVGKDPTVLIEYADALAMSQGGQLSGRPEAQIAHALALNPRHPAVLDMAGSLAYEQGRYADSVGYWRELLGLLPPGSPRRQELSVAIQRAEQRASVMPAR